MSDTTDHPTGSSGSSRRVVDVPIDLHEAVTQIYRVADHADHADQADHADERPPLESLDSRRSVGVSRDETERMPGIDEPLASLDSRTPTREVEGDEDSSEFADDAPSRSRTGTLVDSFRSVTARLTDPHLWAGVGKQLRDAARVSWDRITQFGNGAKEQSRQLGALAGPVTRKAGRTFDRNAGTILLLSTLVLLSLGAVLIFSSSSKVAMESESMRDPAFFFKKHLVFLGVALLGCLAGFCIPAEKLRKRAPAIYIGALALLVLVLIPGIGTSFNGARRWFRFGPIGFQPSDLAKLALVVALAHHLSLGRVRRNFASFERGFVPFIAILAPVCGLIVLEPDFGTTLFLCGVSVTMYLIAGGRARHIALAAVPLILLMAIVVIVKFDHVQPRIDAWVNPDADPSGKGYQVRQSLIALGAGGSTGVGLGQSRQALWYLPEESTDFIFAILGEELGFLGVLLALTAYMLLVMAGFRIAARAPDRFRQLLAAGMTLLIGLQAAINIAVVTAAVPNKGIALPFISFGGSLTFFYLVAVGVILGVAVSIRETECVADGQPEPDPTGSDDRPRDAGSHDSDEEASDPINPVAPAADEETDRDWSWRPHLAPAFASAQDIEDACQSDAGGCEPESDELEPEFEYVDDDEELVPEVEIDDADATSPHVIDTRILSSRRSRQILPVTEKVLFEDDPDHLDQQDDRRIA